MAPTRSPGVRLKPLGHLSRVVLLDEKLECSGLSVYGALLEPGTYAKGRNQEAPFLPVVFRGPCGSTKW